MTVGDIERGGVVVRGLPPASGASSTIQVFPREAPWWDRSYPSIDGAIERVRGGERFAPRYPFVAGAAYRVVWRHPNDSSIAYEVQFTVPDTELPHRGRVVQIYPTADTLPENQLKFYVHFSRPMDRRQPYDHVRLYDADTGVELDHVFHAMRAGLWDVSGTRLTVVFDPGRVKRGLANREAWGPPIRAGRRYRLVVDGTWPDADGRSLVSGSEKEFVVAPPDRQRPDPARWSLTTPPARTRQPLTVAFDEPMDQAIAEHALHVLGASEPMRGDVSFRSRERVWQFTPSEPWRPGAYALVVECRVEDLAGNNLTRLFDHDLDHDGPVETESDECTATVPFRIADAPLTQSTR